MERHYFKRAWADMRASGHWLRKLMLLALISLIPIFGPITVSGYFYRWAKTAVTGGDAAMPDKLLGGPDDHQFLVGFRVFVVGLIIVGLPLFVLSIITSVFSALSASHSWATIFVVALSFIAVVASFFLTFLYWAASMRATVEESIGAGLSIKEAWAQLSSDGGGCAIIFLIGFACSFALSALMSVLSSIFIFLFTFAVMFMVAGDPQISALLAGLSVDPALTLQALLTYVGPQLIGVLAVFGLLMVVLVYFMVVAGTFTNAIMTRCVGFWTADVALRRGDTA